MADIDDVLEKLKKLGEKIDRIDYGVRLVAWIVFFAAFIGALHFLKPYIG